MYGHSWELPWTKKLGWLSSTGSVKDQNLAQNTTTGRRQTTKAKESTLWLLPVGKKQH